jgi:hypothetical protein
MHTQPFSIEEETVFEESRVPSYLNMTILMQFDPKEFSTVHPDVS